MYQPPMFPNEDVRAILKLWVNGQKQRTIAVILAIPYTRVNSVVQRYRLGGYRDVNLGRISEPPSPAMIRLAEFDPVIARALKQRLGEGT